LYDRRHVGRVLKREWGEVPRAGEEVTTCVRRFGRPKERGGERNSRREHVTGARISPSNGHEVIHLFAAFKAAADILINRCSFVSFLFF